MLEFLKILVQFFERHQIPYMLSGSMAMSTYTGPRYTRDFDFIVHLKPTDAALVAGFFQEGYYCDEEAVHEAIATGGMFNIIDHKSNYKADFVLLKQLPFRVTEFERRIPVKFLDMQLYIVTKEDLLISKLIWIQELQSSIQAEDIKLLASLEGLDRAYIRHWVASLKLNTFDLFNND